MKKIRITIDMEIDEQELNEMKSSQNGYEPLTVQEYFDGIEFKKDGYEMTFSNEIETYYNTYEGDSNCIKNANVTSIDIIEQ